MLWPAMIWSFLSVSKISCSCLILHNNDNNNNNYNVMWLKTSTSINIPFISDQFVCSIFLFFSVRKKVESKLFHLILISSLLQSAEKDAAISRGDLLFLIMFSNNLLAWAMVLHRNICLTLILFSNLTSRLEPKMPFTCCYQHENH